VSALGDDPRWTEAPHRDIAAAAAFRAVQSTPLIERTGRLVGMVSTHYPRPYSPSERDLEIMKRYGELAGQAMADHARNPSGSSPPPGVADRRPPTPIA
jgi:GAF domain-containing protein